jgi:hypothetical protein
MPTKSWNEIAPYYLGSGIWFLNSAAVERDRPQLPVLNPLQGEIWKLHRRPDGNIATLAAPNRGAAVAASIDSQALVAPAFAIHSELIQT